ncbi:MAG: cupin domain-containing protein [Sporolactobacillus sp.]
MTAYLDYASPQASFSFDINTSRFFTKDAGNYINMLGIEQLNTLDNLSLLDIFLSSGNIIEPHIHQNAAELVYCVSGAAIVSLLNPFTKVIQNYQMTLGQVTNIPQGWWHYEVATADGTHLLAIFNAPTPEVTFGSDMLRLTPAALIAHTYCLDQAAWQRTIAPITGTSVIGPPAGCQQTVSRQTQAPSHSYLYPQQQS